MWSGRLADGRIQINLDDCETSAARESALSDFLGGVRWRAHATAVAEALKTRIGKPACVRWPTI